MNRTLIVLLTLVVVVGAAVGVTLYLQSTASVATTTSGQQGVIPVTLPDTPPAPSLDNNSKDAVQTAFKAELAKHPSDNTKLGQTVIVGDYALQLYAGDITSGQALLKYDHTQGRWILVDAGGGVWNVNELMAVGVPRATAQALLAGLSH